MKSIASHAHSKKIKAAFGLVFVLFSAAAVQAGSVQVSVVDREGKPAQDAVVVLVHATVRNASTNLPAMATIVNEKMQFIPAVTVVAKGAKVRFVNNDPWDHHVRGAPPPRSLPTHLKPMLEPKRRVVLNCVCKAKTKARVPNFKM